MEAKPEMDVMQKNWASLNACGVIKRLILASIGLAVITHDRLETHINYLEVRGRQATRDVGASFVNRSKDHNHSLCVGNGKINKQIQGFVSNYKIPNSEDLNSLKLIISELDNEIDPLINNQVSQ